MKSRFATAGVLAVVAAVYLAGGLEFLERNWMDARFRLAERPASADVVLVDIDPRSLATLDVWPWPRGYHATVLERLLEAGARDVGFDIDFSSRSDADEDGEFEQALAAASGHVVLPVFVQWQRAAGGVRKVRVEPLPEFRRHARLGSINVRPGKDGLVRRYESEAVSDRDRVAPFAVALSGDDGDEHRHFYLDFGINTATIPRVSYLDVLTGMFDPAQVRGRRVIIGSSALELNDQIAVPVTSVLPGPLLQALAYESLHQGRALRRASPWLTLSGTLLLGWLLGPWLAALSWKRGLGATLAAVAVVLVLSVVVQRSRPTIVDVAPFVLASVALYGLALTRRIDQQALRLLAEHLRVRRVESHMRHVVDNSLDAIVTIDTDGTVESFNRSAQRMFGLAEDDALGRSIERLIRPARLDGPGLDWRHPSPGPIEATGRRSDGRGLPIELIVTAAESVSEPKLVAFLRDITERKAQQRALEHQATHDALTDLPNRTLLRSRMAEALEIAAANESPLAVLLIDLDGFKEINDALGHPTGDVLLQQVARRLRDALELDQMIARLGGDEFGLLLPGSDRDAAVAVGKRLIAVVREPFAVQELSLQVDTSLGIALYPEHGTDGEALLQHADVAMYAAKEQRSGVEVYRPDEDLNSMRHLMLRGDLRRAIEDDVLALAYQPKVSAEDDRVIGLEALLRWRHPLHGLIPPDEFVTLAEHGGLIRQLTRWVLENALRQGATWLAKGIDLTISVNLSARNLLEEDLPSTLERLLHAQNLPPERLILEITESVIMEDPDRALTVMSRLRDLDIGISIDDFGTGYSSLAYLMKLPAQEIKIDKSFVMPMEQDEGSATIVKSTIELAHNLGLRVVAEGVESLPIWYRLKQLGCDVGQGYHFSRPLPSDQVSDWLSEPSDAVEPLVIAPPLQAALTPLVHR